MNFLKIRSQHLILYFYNLRFFKKKEWTLQKNSIKIYRYSALPKKNYENEFTQQQLTRQAA